MHNTVIRDQSGHFNREPLAQTLFQKIVSSKYVFNSNGLISLITAVGTRAGVNVEPLNLNITICAHSSISQNNNYHILNNKKL